jgi:hypothetical protein
VTDAPIAGWYPDPRNTDAEWRWWNGRDWTHETAPRTPAVVRPVRRAQDWGWETPSAAASGPGAYRTQAIAPVAPPAGWTWFMVFGGYVWSLFAAVFQIIGLVAFGYGPVGSVVGVEYGQSQLAFIVSLAAWVVAVIPMLVFAELDNRSLKAHVLSAPSGLLMFILPNVVYYLVRRSRLARAGVRFKVPDIVFFVLYGLQVAGFMFGVFLIVTTLPLMFSLDTLTP